MSPSHAARGISRGLLSSPFAKFLVVGAVSYLVNQASLVLMYEYLLGALPRNGPGALSHLDVALLISSSIAVEVSIIVRFALNDRWTFPDRRRQSLRDRFVQSNLVSAGSPLISLATVNILTPVFGINYLLANSIGILLGLSWNWIGSTRIVWRDAPAERRA